MAALKEGGLELSPEFTIEDLLSHYDRLDYELSGWYTTVVGLATCEPKEPFRDHCKNLWEFDTECIEDHGDYKIIAERLVEMTQGSLPITDITDYVDVEEGEAWISFRLGGKEIRFDCTVEDDWVDRSIFSKFNRLLSQTDSSKCFITYYLPSEQNLILGCVKKDQLEALKKLDAHFKEV